MPRYTRKRGGGLLNRFRGRSVSPQQQIANLEAQKAMAMRKSKSRVANVLSQPGQVVYTNKQRIDAEFGAKIKELMSQIENPQEAQTAVSGVVSSIEAALKSQAARETGAVFLTIPVGVAQLFVKAARIFLALLILVFGFVPAGVLGSNALVTAVAAAAPNLKFNTTASAYKGARGITGANRRNTNVQEYQ